MGSGCSQSCISSQALEALSRPIGEARGLPGSVYASPEFFALENRELWPKCWTPVAFTSDIPSPGSVAPTQVGGLPLIVARGQDGVIRSFLNICPHRANRLVNTPAKGQRAIRCGWHSWSFDLQGRFLGAPHLADRGGEVPSEGGSPPSLKAVRTAEWMGTVFVNLDGSAPELHEQTLALYNHYKEWEGLDGLRPIATIEQTWDANWKLWVEGGIEDYHLHWVHPNLLEDAIEWKTEPRRLGSEFFGLVSSQRKRPKPADSDQAITLPHFPGTPETARSNGGFFVMFPAFGLNVRTNYIRTYYLTPLAPNRTAGRSQLLVLPEAIGDPRLQPTVEKLVELWTRVWREDAPICAAVQKSAEVRDQLGSPTRFVAGWEESVQQFELKLVETMDRC